MLIEKEIREELASAWDSGVIAWAQGRVLGRELADVLDANPYRS